MATTVPTLIQDTETLDTATGRRRVTASPEAAGAAPARALTTVARGLDTVADKAIEIDDELNVANARELDNQLSARIRDRFHNETDGYFSTERGRGRNARDNEAAIQGELDAIAAELGQQARSPRAAALYQDVARRRLNTAFGDIAERASSQEQAYLNEVDTTALSEARDNIIAAYDDPVALARNLATADAIIARTATRNGLGPELTQRAIDEYRSDIFSRVIVQLAATDPERAEEMFLLHAPDMTAQDRAELGSQMRAARRQAEENIIDEAWTYVARGERVPGELWARVPGRAQIDIQNEIRRRAEGGSGMGNQALIERLNDMAATDPQSFARVPLSSMRSALGGSYNDFVLRQAQVREGGVPTDVAQMQTQYNALRNTAASALGLRLTAQNPEDLSDAANAFNAALLREVQSYAAANPGQGIDTETGQLLIGRAWVGMRGRDVSPIQGRTRGDRGRARNPRVRSSTEVNVPYAAIPERLRDPLQRQLRRRLRLQQGEQLLQGDVENAYAAILAADPKTPEELEQVWQAIIIGGGQ